MDDLRRRRSSCRSTAFDNPARASLIPNLVPREHLANALSLNIFAWQAATVVGPAIAGNLIAWFGVTVVYTIDAVSFLAMIAALVTISAEVRVDAASRPDRARFGRGSGLSSPRPLSARRCCSTFSRRSSVARTFLCRCSRPRYSVSGRGDWDCSTRRRRPARRSPAP
ncbi:MAG: MFS transporter [Blastocatellia bacterium]|nr:MFS transporter [Blastocatellia bacterium]